MMSRVLRSSQLWLCLLGLVVCIQWDTAVGQTGNRVALNIEQDAVELLGEISGTQSQDYILSAHASQTLTVRFTTEHPTTAFVSVLAPGAQGTTLHNGATDGNDAVLRLAVNGDYVLRVFATGTALFMDQRIPYKMEVTLK